MNLTVYPTSLSGTVTVPPSKSQCHRFLLASALCHGETLLQNCGESLDLNATLDGLAALGALVSRHGNTVSVVGFSCDAGETIHCGGSGTTLRFFLPVLCALGQEARFTMEGRLPHRPLKPLWDELLRHGAVLSHTSENTISVSGKLTDPHFTLAGNVSSQFLSGILFALPLMGGGTLTIRGELQSASYVDLTIEALSRFGITVTETGSILTVSGQYTSPGTASIEGDWSQAAFWCTANRMGSSIRLEGLSADSVQGDRTIDPLLDAVDKGNAVLDAGNCPDLVSILAVYAACHPGVTQISNAKRLRWKESDRLAATAALVRQLGAEATEREDGLTIYGKARLSGGTVDAAGDHRIAMSAAIAALCSDSPVTILGAEAVEKSYPLFWRDFRTLHGIVKQKEPL